MPRCILCPHYNNSQPFVHFNVGDMLTYHHIQLLYTLRCIHLAITLLRFQRITALPTKLAEDFELGIGIKRMKTIRKITINITGDRIESVSKE